MIIAIDGTAAAGKSTLARRIAQRYGLPHLDTGSLYRAVARDVQFAGHSLDDADAAAEAARTLDPATLSDPGLRLKGRGEAASVVAAFPQVRAALLMFQRSFAAQPGGAVVEGRDIGTVVFPDAELKIYLDASPEVRASRRSREVADLAYETVATDLARRDALDQGRADSPLREATDAIVIDTSDLTVDDIVDAVLGHLHEVD